MTGEQGDFAAGGIVKGSFEPVGLRRDVRAYTKAMTVPEWERPLLTLCSCGDPQSSHEHDRDSCGMPDCVCDRFVQSSVPSTEPASAKPDYWASPGDTESTSAALRRVEQERDDAVAAAVRTDQLWRETAVKYEASIARAEQERDDALHAVALRQGALAVARQRAGETQRQRDDARAELFSALTELDAVRAARDTLDRELSEVRAEADEKVRAVLAADYRPAAVVHAYDALYCRTCYARFLPETPAAETHPHPLVPVRVSITSRTEEHETA